MAAAAPVRVVGATHADHASYGYLHIEYLRDGVWVTDMITVPAGVAERFAALLALKQPPEPPKG